MNMTINVYPIVYVYKNPTHAVGFTHENGREANRFEGLASHYFYWWNASLCTFGGSTFRAIKNNSNTLVLTVRPA